MKRLFVGNLPFNTTDNDLLTLFSSFGNVEAAHVIMDRATGRSRGFGFVEMETTVAEKAIAELNDSDYGGRRIRVNEAQKKESREGGRERSYSAKR